MRVIVAMLALMLTGCCKPETVRVPGPVEYRDRLVVQPVASELLQPHPIATGPLSQCPDVAAARKRELEQCNAHKAQIREGQE